MLRKKFIEELTWPGENFGRYEKYSRVPTTYSKNAQFSMPICTTWTENKKIFGYGIRKNFI